MIKLMESPSCWELVDNLFPNDNYPETSGIEDPVGIEHESVDMDGT